MTMDDSKLAGLAPLSGLVFVVLLVAGALVINNYDYLPPSEEIRAFYEDAATRVQVGAYVIMVSAFFLMWFAGSLRSSLRPAEGGAGRLSAVAFGGGMVAGALLLLAYAAMFTAASRAGAESGIAAETATALHDLQAVVTGQALPIALAVTVGASAVVSLRNRVFSSWLSWVSAILAVGLLSPLGWVFLVVALLWVAAVSVILYTTRTQMSPPSTA